MEVLVLDWWKEGGLVSCFGIVGMGWWREGGRTSMGLGGVKRVGGGRCWVERGDADVDRRK